MNQTEEYYAHLWLDGDASIPIKMRDYLLLHYDSAEQIFQLNPCMIRQCLEKDFSRQDIDKLLYRKDNNFLTEYKEKLEERNIWTLYPGCKSYPDKLLHIYDPPRFLYGKGKVKDSINYYNRNIAIVGSRDADVYNMETARYFARELAKEGINIISGMARGIDSQAHFGCMEASGYTVAVLGSGINVPYPRSNLELYERICNFGMVVSEYGLDVPPLSFQFPIRNRIISGLSDGVLVTCAKKKSGSLITADLALEQGKPVYAFPGRAMDVFSQGNNHLIKMGAACTTEPSDILEDFFYDTNGGMSAGEQKEDSCSMEDIEKLALAPTEKMVYSLLGLDPVYIDDIIETGKIGVTKTISTLYELEEKGLIKQPMRGYYIRKL